MNIETDYLKTIAEEIATNKIEHIQPPVKPNHHLLNEAKRLERSIITHLAAIENFTQRNTFHFNTLSKLVNVCDILFDVYNRITPDVKVMMDLLTSIKRVIPDEIRPNLKLTKAFVEMQLTPISEAWLHQSSVMIRYYVPEKLIAIAGIPFRRFIEPKGNLLWGDFTWLRGYQAKLDILDWENPDCNSPSEALLSLLIGRDFNDDRFFIYCKKYIKDRTKAVSGKRNRLLAYAECEKLVLEDTQTGMPSFDCYANSVSTRLVTWIRNEIDFVETHEREQTFAKLHFHLYVNRIAFFFKLLSEQKVFGETSFKDLSQQVASTCLSIDGEEISAGTIISKAYPKDQKMLEEMEDILVKMLSYVRSFIKNK